MILYVGRLQRIKGVHFLLEAVRRLPTSAKVVVCGAVTESGYEEELMQAGGNTVFLGRRSDIPELMAAADLLVMPSDIPETQGLVIHESMACGTPVVASDVGGLTASMAGFPNQLVKPGDAVALSGVIERFLHWRHDDPGLGERSRKWVSSHLSIGMTGDSVHSILSCVRLISVEVVTPGLLDYDPRSTDISNDFVDASRDFTRDRPMARALARVRSSPDRESPGARMPRRRDLGKSL